MNSITFEQLMAQVERAASCASVKLPASELTPLLILAMRQSCKNPATIAGLQLAARDVEVELTGDGIRVILDLALQAKVAEETQRPRSKVVPSSTK